MSISNTFVAAAQTDEVPAGTTKRVEINGHPYLLANVDGSLHAVDDTCTHEDSSLSLGCLKGELVSCTLHGSRFNVRTGEPLEEPAEEPLNTYETRIEAGTIYIRPG